MGLGNYTGEFTHDFFKGPESKKGDNPLPITITGFPPIPTERAIRANSRRAVIVYQEETEAES